MARQLVLNPADRCSETGGREQPCPPAKDAFCMVLRASFRKAVSARRQSPGSEGVMVKDPIT
jgi:hypothetical protein